MKNNGFDISRVEISVIMYDTLLDWYIVLNINTPNFQTKTKNIEDNFSFCVHQLFAFAGFKFHFKEKVI